MKSTTYHKLAAKFNNLKKPLTRKKKTKDEDDPEPHVLLDISELWIKHILPQLHPQELLVMTKVSKNFNLWSSYSSLWRAIYANQFMIDVRMINTEDWKQYFLERKHFKFVGPVEVRKSSNRRNNWKKHFTKEKSSSVHATIDCGITGQGKLCFLGPGLEKRIKDIQLSPDVLILALYITRNNANVTNSIVIEAIPVLAFITTKSLYVIEYPNIEARNRWLKEIATNFQPLVRMVLIDLIGAN